MSNGRFNNGMTRKNAMIVPESAYGVCLWELPEGYLCDGPGNYLSIEGIVGDPECERILRETAESYIGKDTGGKPHWMRGHRKVTNNEHDDQQERLRDGFIPDWEEEIRLAMKEQKKK